MKHCVKCGKKVNWVMGQTKWILVDMDNSSSNYNREHALVCRPNNEYIKKRERLMLK